MEKKYNEQARSRFRDVKPLSAENHPVDFEEWLKVSKQLDENGY